MLSSRSLLIELPLGTEITGENYVKTNATLAYPEAFLKTIATLQMQVEGYMKIGSKLQAEKSAYLKTIPALQGLLEFYIRIVTAFNTPSRFIKTIAALQAVQSAYIRVITTFDYHATYLRIDATLVLVSPLPDLGGSPPATQPGLLSRQYLSIASVKKDVT